MEHGRQPIELLRVFVQGEMTHRFAAVKTSASSVTSTLKAMIFSPKPNMPDFFFSYRMKPSVLIELMSVATSDCLASLSESFPY